MMADFDKQSAISWELVRVKEEDEFVPAEANDLSSMECEDFNFSSVVKEECDFRLEEGRENADYFSGNESQSLELPEDLVDRVFTKYENDNQKEWEEFFSRFNVQHESSAVLPGTSATINMGADTKDPNITLELVGYYPQYLPEHTEDYEHSGHSASAQSVVNEEELDSFFSKFNMEVDSQESDSELEQDGKRRDCLTDDQHHSLEIPEDRVDRVFSQNVDDNEGEWAAFFSKFNRQNREILAILPSTGSVIDTGIKTHDIKIKEEPTSYHSQPFSEHQSNNNQSDNNHRDGKCENCTRNRFCHSVDMICSKNKFRRDYVKAPLSSYTLYDGSVVKLKQVSVVLEDLFSKNYLGSSKNKKTKFNRLFSLKTAQIRKRKGSGNIVTTAGNRCLSRKVPADLSGKNAPNEEELDAFFSKFNMQEDKNLENLPPARSLIDAGEKTKNRSINRELVVYHPQYFSELQENCGCCDERGEYCVENHSCSSLYNRSSIYKLGGDFFSVPSSSVTFYDKSAVKLKPVSVVLEDIFQKNGSFQKHRSASFNCFSVFKTAVTRKKRKTAKSSRKKANTSGKKCHPMEISEDLVDRAFAQPVVEEDLDAFFSKFNMQEDKNLKNLVSASFAIDSGAETKDRSTSRELVIYCPQPFFEHPKDRDHYYEKGGNCIQNSSVDIRNSSNKFGRNFVSHPQLSSSNIFYDKNLKLKNFSVVLEDIFSKKSIRSAPTGYNPKNKNILHEKCDPLEIPENVAERVFAQNAVNEEELDAFFSKFNMQGCENFTTFQSTSSVIETEIKPQNPNIMGDSANSESQYLLKHPKKRRLHDFMKFQQREEADKIDRHENSTKSNSCTSMDVRSPLKYDRAFSDALMSSTDLFHNANALKLLHVSIVLEDLFPKNSSSSWKDKILKFDCFSGFETAVIKNEEDLTITKNRGTKLNLSGSRDHSLKIPEDIVSRICAKNLISEREMDAFFFRFNTQDSKNFAVAPPLVSELQEKTKRLSILKQLVNHDSQYVFDQSDECGLDNKSQIKAVKCEGIDREINNDRKYLENNFSDTVDIKIPVNESSRQFVTVRQLLSNSFQSSANVERMCASMELDLSPKPQCGSETCNRTKFKRIRRSVDNYKKRKHFKSPVCALEHRSSVFMRRHSVMCHGWHLCTLCAAKFDHERDLIRHRRAHLRKNFQSCQECEKNLKSKFSIQRCEQCHLRFKMKRASRHARSKNNRPYSCAQCFKTFKFAETWKKHVKRHLDQKFSTCEWCGAKFRTKEEMSRHLLVYNDQRCFSCADCSETFTTPCELRQHSSTHFSDTSSSPGKCEPKTFSHEQLESSNFNDVVYPCVLCGAKFMSKNSLATHMVVHSNEKPFVCHLCSVRFKLKCDLHTHFKEIHCDENCLSNLVF